MSEIEDIVATARKQARCIYIAVEESVADDIAGSLNALADEIDRLTAERDEAREALNVIAAWDDEGANEHLARTGSYGRFDEPGSVQRARAALKEKPE